MESFHIPCVTDGKTSDSARSAVRKAAAEIAKPQQDVQLPDPVAAGALELLESVLLSPEPSTEELHEMRAKLAMEIEAALRRRAPPPRRFSDD
jgi:hypothetical protein